MRSPEGRRDAGKVGMGRARYTSTQSQAALDLSHDLVFFRLDILLCNIAFICVPIQVAQQIALFERFLRS